MSRQEKVVKRLVKYADEMGEECSVMLLPNSKNVMEYKEEREIDYEFRIRIRENGSVSSFCFCTLEIDAEKRDICEDYFSQLGELSNFFIYDYDREEGTIYVASEFSKETQKKLEDNFEKWAFRIPKIGFEDCMAGLLSLLEGDITMEDAIAWGLDFENDDEEDSIEELRYEFEHRLLNRCFFEQEDFFQLLKENKSKHVYTMLKELCEENEMEMPYDEIEYNVLVEEIGENSEMIRLKMPEPEWVNNCKEIILVKSLKKDRYFTIELGEEDNWFLCEWALNKEEGYSHCNWGFIEPSEDIYITKIKNIL